MDVFYLASKLLRKSADFLESLSPKGYMAEIAPTARIFPSGIIDNFSNNKELISIGANSVILGQILVFAHDGKIGVGRDCFIGEGSRIWSASSIQIGDRVFIAHGVNIHDTNSHSLDPVLRHQHIREVLDKGHPTDNIFNIESKPIAIASDVWIGFNSTILKGVTIGEGAVVAACTLITHDVPSWTVVAGNPARVIRKLEPVKVE
jgi:acetyltransferase-like isoleucine patch superfamily enzyme